MTNTPPTPTKKKCPLCEKGKPLDDFPKYSKHKDGRSDWCRLCWAAKRAEKAAISKKPQTAKKAAPAKVAATSTKAARKAVERAGEAAAHAAQDQAKLDAAKVMEGTVTPADPFGDASTSCPWDEGGAV